ncbi:putative transcription factor interactor and regulator LisH family [Medicago truncatula]|uniref:Putative transcription factor interactor and regulator LisH family n=1 Tax=Medicago truncatula TaxID=3880 RepID=A0A396HAW0_MEDTR|nr:putative transcription factor interactor and regulator LisH family [Medicago truncatula]
MTDYELRLAQEDITKLKAELQTKTEYSTIDDATTKSSGDVSVNNGGGELQTQQQKGNNHSPVAALGPVKENERRDLNCAVKEYLLIAGYRLTAMTFYEEVTDQNLDIRHNTNALVPDALRHYYYHYLSSTSQASEEKIAQVREIEALLKETQSLNEEKESLSKDKDFTDGQIRALTKSLGALQEDLKQKENTVVQVLKKSLENQRKELHDCRVQIRNLKKHNEGFGSGNSLVVGDVDNVLPESLDKYKEEINKLQMEVERLKEKNRGAAQHRNFSISENELLQTEDKFIEMHEDKGATSHSVDEALDVVHDEEAHSPALQTLDEFADKHTNSLLDLFNPVHTNTTFENIENVSEQNGGKQDGDNKEAIFEKMARTIQILADALPKIVPYVLINHREELLPLMMCAIEYHPDSRTRDSLTHTLFNLIKRPDEQQRWIIMDACVSLAKNVGEMRTETELLPQCWEQINHMYEERRLLVAQSCGELAEFVRPEIRDSLILSIVQQLVEDSATIVREDAVHNLAKLLPLFPNMDKYFKVEELMFQLICDPSGVVVETTLKELVPAVIKWGNKLDHVLVVSLSHIVSSAQRCPTLSVVEGRLESHLHVLGERERWNIDVLLRMLVELLSLVHQRAIETCPFLSNFGTTNFVLSTTLLELYARENVEWNEFEWMHVECFPKLIQLACLLPWKEDNLRSRISKFLLSVSERFGDTYVKCIMLPVFLTAVGDDADLSFFPKAIHLRIKGLRPRSSIAERLSASCVLPLLLAGVLGGPRKRKELIDYSRKLLLEDNSKENPSTKHTPEIVNAIRFICIYEENHGMIFDILWEMVVSSNVSMKVTAAKLLKALVPYIDVKVASTNALPALVTLGSEQNLDVKCASIDAFGAVAQHFRNEMVSVASLYISSGLDDHDHKYDLLQIIDKIRVQMGAFLEDGSHEAMIAVIHALITQLTAVPITTSADLKPRQERANAFCEAIRALDATDLSANSVRDYLLPAIQNLLKDLDALDPAHKEALDIIMKERSGTGYKVGIAGSMSNFFGDGGLRGKKDITESPSERIVSPKGSASQSPPAEDTRFRRIMLGHFSDILRGKGKTPEETQN